MDELLHSHIVFANPWWLLLLCLLPVWIFLYIRNRRRQQAYLQVSSTRGMKQLPVSWKMRFRSVLMVLRMLVYALLVMALARPQTTDVLQNVNSEGIDIIICLDISGSMLAQDFHPNRIEAAKAVAKNFIEHRPNDRIGLVIFAGQAFTQCPLTIDHDFLIQQLEKVHSGLLEDGTAIGDGLATAVQRLRESSAKSKVVILLTDGVNNMGLIDPMTALQIAKTYGVRVYTIGIGTHGVAPYPVPMPGGGTQLQDMPVQIDEALLQKIARQTGGEYFRATGNTSLRRIYDQIDQMEKTKIQVSSFTQYADVFFPLAMAAAVLLFLEILLRYTVFKTFP
ncbi:vWA domain-containing protein [Thermoflavifilum thermophilum]|uniref:Ca-activated chloride channel family protein n=1 Tax=Thermoflavifilum thermophilum TaxID=1393122 RepID=A0A1I7N8G0_9BACT|nr:VWA domain-containing protein [Thermoflavifilum thermophilum]SFV30957.1 Ca-activated chloride channel family protein [Thermoflavifilum thermophilum]